MQPFEQLVQRMEDNPKLEEKMKEDPKGTLATLSLPLQTDVWIYRFVVVSLGLAILTAVGGALMLAFHDKDTPEVVIALGSAAVGAMAGLLAPSPSR